MEVIPGGPGQGFLATLAGRSILFEAVNEAGDSRRATLLWQDDDVRACVRACMHVIEYYCMHGSRKHDGSG